MGSEGIFGIITEAVVKIRPLPEAKEYESIIFHDYSIGIKFMYEVGMSKIWPASIRMIDNVQFGLGANLKLKTTSFLK